VIAVDLAGIGSHDKSEKIITADLGRRLVIEWTAQLPPTSRAAVKQ